MRSFFNTGFKTLRTCALGVLALMLLSCGSATNNDQGTSITLLGFFAEFPDSVDCKQLPAGSLGAAVPIELEVDEASGTVPGTRTIAGIQNNLSQQFFRTDHAVITYHIEGADIQPPSTTAPVSFFIRPAAASGATATTASDPFDSSLPPSFAGDSCSIGFAEFFVLPADIQTWINFNKTSLPEAPFNMYATVYFSGLTSAGDRYDTNTMVYTLIMTPSPIIVPTEAPAPTGGDTLGDTTGTTDETTF